MDVAFGLSDCELFARYPKSISFNDVPPDDKNHFKSIRDRLKQLADQLAALAPAGLRLNSFVSHHCPSGRTTHKIWSCVHPSDRHKSFALQVAMIISARGAEICFCLGSGTGEIKDESERRRNHESLQSTQATLGHLPTELVSTVAKLGSRPWYHRERWLSNPNESEFGSLEGWLKYASSPSGVGASISTYLAPAELESMGTKIGDVFQAALNKFALILEHVYRDNAPIESGGNIVTTPRFWVIAAGKAGTKWPMFQERGVVSIGWSRLGDLRQYSSQDDILDALRNNYESDSEPTNMARCCFEFTNTMRIGDYVIAKTGRTSILGVGVVTSDYRFDENFREHPNFREVSWRSVETSKLTPALGLPIKTLTDITMNSELISFIRNRYPELADEPQPEPVESFDIDEAILDLFLSRDEFDQMLRALTRKKNLVVQGPPGVGKTYIARLLAYGAIGVVDNRRIEMVQFHQSYSYEDFVQGFRPCESGGFRRENGVFYKFCRRAQKDLSKPYVFIIDEINRGSLSKILGELMILIEHDKRGSKYAIPLVYSNKDDERFYVPENLHIIGLMNTADRSLAMVDYALRRRFAFFDLEPQFGTDRFRDHLVSAGIPEDLTRRIIDRMTELNNKISEDHKNLGRGYQIGHSFFCTPLNGDSPEDWFRQIISVEVAPLIREYWVDSRKRAEEWIDKLLTP